MYNKVGCRHFGQVHRFEGTAPDVCINKSLISDTARHLPRSLSTYLPTYLSTYLPIYPPTHPTPNPTHPTPNPAQSHPPIDIQPSSIINILFMCLLFSPSFCLFCLSLCLSACLLVHRSVISLYVCLFMCLPIGLSVFCLQNML